MEEWRPVAPVDEMTDDTGTTLRSKHLADRVRHARSLVHWFGLGRILTATVTIPLLAAGVYLLVRTPAAPIEASIDYATTVVTTSTTKTTTTDTVTRDQVLVHVAGHVYAPGVYSLDIGQRIVDAIRAAGGAQPIADLNAINLALAVGDGDQVYVPAVGEVQLSSTVGRVGGGPPSVDNVFPVDINTASAEMLEELPGIGPSTAAAIISHRNKIGTFATASDLLDVPGIGAAKFDAIKDLVTT